MSLQGFCTLKPKTLQTEILGAPLYPKHSNGLGTFSQATSYGEKAERAKKAWPELAVLAW